MSLTLLITMLLAFAFSISIAVAIGGPAILGIALFDPERLILAPKEMFTAIDKFPLITKDVPGFLVNKVLTPYMFAAFERLEKGEDKEKIDEAVRTFGMPMGPIELIDTVGLDICLHVAKILGGGGTEGSRLERLVSSGRLGKKTGEGFYVWKDGKPVRGEAKWSKAELEKVGREIVEPIIRESQKALDEGVVASADLVDAGMIFGTGFAPFRGGPLHFQANETKSGAAEPRAAAE